MFPSFLGTKKMKPYSSPFNSHCNGHFGVALVLWFATLINHSHMSGKLLRCANRITPTRGFRSGALHVDLYVLCPFA